MRDRCLTFRVVFANYFPREVDSTHSTREEAERRADELNAGLDWDAWRVEEDD